MKAVFDHSRPEAANITTYYFKPERPVRHTAGQFTELRLPHENRDKRGEKRWFTISASPTEELLSITTKFAAENGSSFKQVLKNLQPGTPLNLADPMGDFVLPKDLNIPLVFVAGGIGLTPFRSMVKWLTDTGESRDIKMLYALKNSDEIIFRDLFSKYGVDQQIIVSTPRDDWKGLSGKLDSDRILEFIGDAGNSLIYISGPEPLVETFDKDLKSSGINKKQIVTDFFPGYMEV